MELNAKCLKCGYTFEADLNSEKCTCPLCSNEFNTKDVAESFIKSCENLQPATEANKGSPLKMLGQWALFGVSFVAFIVILYFIISFIVSL